MNFGFLADPENFTFPACLDCSDKGIVEVEGSPFDGKGPCACAAGGSSAKTNFPHWEALKTARAKGERFDAKERGICPKCAGRRIVWDHHNGEHNCGGCGGTGEYFTESTGDWKRDLRLAVYAEGDFFAGFALAYADVEGNADGVVIRAKKDAFFGSSLEHESVTRAAARVANKPVSVTVDYE